MTPPRWNTSPRNTITFFNKSIPSLAVVECSVIIHYIYLRKNYLRWGMHLIIWNILRGPFGSAADINGCSLVSLIQDQSSVTILVLPCCIFLSL